MGQNVKASAAATIIPAEQGERSFLLVRGQKVMLDSDLAALYEVETGQLVSIGTPIGSPDFAFHLT